MPRIVSLIASATEIVCALGFSRDLVGRSHECDFPPSILNLPVCTEPRFNIHGSSGDIDQRVKSLLQESNAVYRVHEDLLEQLKPDVIVTQAQCEVCAVSLKEVERAVCSWREGQPRIVTLQPDSLTDVWNDIAKVAEALQVPYKGTLLIQQLQQRIEGIAEHVRTLGGFPTVACLEWLEPLMTAGNWMPELVELAGGINLFGKAGKHSPWLKWEELAERDSDVILALPCGLDLARTRQEMAWLSSKPDWPKLRAVQTGRVYVTDGNQYFNRPGPRLVESVEILAEIFHPDEFRFGHEGTGWQKL